MTKTTKRPAKRFPPAHVKDLARRLEKRRLQRALKTERDITRLAAQIDKATETAGQSLLMLMRRVADANGYTITEGEKLDEGRTAGFVNGAGAEGHATEHLDRRGD